uniref:F-box domain-containing protein n=1 Tax=Oryza meridionalis TaxID=40149 RepID=A0A0E0D7L5_9ORYZ
MASTILPDDLMLEIAVRSDIVSIVRCAATCRSLRGRILEEEFCRRHRAGGSNAATSLLRGVSYRFRCDLNTFVGVTTQAASSPSSSPLPRFDAGILNTFEPMVSRDGLVVVLEDYVYAAPDRFNMCVCNTITGDVTSLPAMDRAMKVKRRLIYPPALLDVGDAGRSFELLVADNELHTQTFSFDGGGGGWGAARTIRMDAGHRKPSIPMPFTTFPAIVGRAVHWLAGTERYWELQAHGVVIFSLRVDAACAATMELPPGSADKMLGCRKDSHELMLAASRGGTALSLVVAERELISVWTLEEEATAAATTAARWSRQVVITRLAIDRSVEAERMYSNVFFEGFGERSGVVLLRLHRFGLVQLNLATKEALVVRRVSTRWSGSISKARLHEVDLYSLLRCMKHFDLATGRE